MVYFRRTNVSLPSYGWFGPGSGIGARRPPMKSCSRASAAVPTASSSTSEAIVRRMHPPPLLAALRLADLAGLERQIRHHLLEVRGVLLRIHAVLHQAQRLDAALERA